MAAVPPKLPVLPRGARLDYLDMGTTPGLRPVPVPDPPPVPVLRCIYCGRIYGGVKPAICQGCGAPLVDMAKSAKEEYEEAYWRNMSLPSAVIRLPAPLTEDTPGWLVWLLMVTGWAVILGTLWLVFWR